MEPRRYRRRGTLATDLTCVVRAGATTPRIRRRHLVCARGYACWALAREHERCARPRRRRRSAPAAHDGTNTAAGRLRRADRRSARRRAHRPDAPGHLPEHAASNQQQTATCISCSKPLDATPFNPPRVRDGPTPRALPDTVRQLFRRIGTLARGFIGSLLTIYFYHGRRRRPGGDRRPAWTSRGPYGRPTCAYPSMPTAAADARWRSRFSEFFAASAARGVWDDHKRRRGAAGAGMGRLPWRIRTNRGRDGCGWRPGRIHHARRADRRALGFRHGRTRMGPSRSRGPSARTTGGRKVLPSRRGRQHAHPA